jgi:hypothetical protein
MEANQLTYLPIAWDTGILITTSSIYGGSNVGNHGRIWERAIYSWQAGLK